MNELYNYSENGDKLFAYSRVGTIAITLTEESGTVVSREKIDTLIGTNHPGLILGNNGWGKRLMVHLHEDNKYPTIDTEDVYSKGQQLYVIDEPFAFDKATIISRAIEGWAEGKKYDKVENNCQQFINRIVNGVNFSPAVDKVSEGLLWGSLIFGIAGAATKNKGLITTAAIMAGAGAYGKFKNR